MVVKLLSFSVCFLCGVASYADLNGIKDLSGVESAKIRLETYLEQAERQSSSRTLFFRVTEASYFQENDKLQLIETSGVVVSDFKEKVFYSCNQKSSDKSELPSRSEILRYNGREKGKFYAVFKDNANGRVKEIEADENGQRASAEKSGVFAIHTEIDPLGLPVTNAIGAKARFSDVKGILVGWSTIWTMKEQEEDKNLLKSIWVDKRRNLVAELTFDNSCGGMPVFLKMYKVDGSGRQTKEYVSETKTQWKQKDESGVWFPTHVLSRSEDRISREFDIDLELLDPSQHKNLVAEVQWADLSKNDNSDWFGAVAKRVVDLFPNVTRTQSKGSQR